MYSISIRNLIGKSKNVITDSIVILIEKKVSETLDGISFSLTYKGSEVNLYPNG